VSSACVLEIRGSLVLCRVNLRFNHVSSRLLRVDACRLPARAYISSAWQQACRRDQREPQFALTLGSKTLHDHKYIQLQLVRVYIDHMCGRGSYGSSMPASCWLSVMARSWKAGRRLLGPRPLSRPRDQEAFVGSCQRGGLCVVLCETACASMSSEVLHVAKPFVPLEAMSKSRAHRHF
jgi:hypothetical protein